MESAEISQIIQRQRQFFASGKTRSVAFRIAQLKKLKAGIKALEAEIIDALRKDLGKSEFESYSSEVGIIYEEINHTIAHVHSWARPRPVPTPLTYQPSTSRIYPQPKGVVLIISPWNYPFQLLIAPLVGAIGAGNCTVLKPSEVAGATCAVVAKLMERTFSPDFCAVVEGGVPETTALLKQQFDHIFFTGSIAVGKVVMRAAAEFLTPVTLELGGKSPCIIDKDLDMTVSARRVAWGKFFNAGQTCVAPDYLLVQKSIKREFIAAMKQQLQHFFGADPQTSPDYARIINEHHFDRLSKLIGGDIAVGGKLDKSTRYMAPTIIDNVKMSDKVMEEEIFGPILPVLEYDTFEDALALARQRPNPLAAYVFTSNSKTEQRFIDELPFGGGCVNNALIHLANPGLPFGGIGTSGMGNYHGQYSFEALSHLKTVVKSAFMLDLSFKYPPYKNNVKLVRKVMR